IHGAVHLHARRVHRLRDHRPGAGDPAHAADVGFELRARHRAGRRDGGARRGGHDAGEGHRFHRRVPRRRQRGRRLCGHGAHAGDVPLRQGRQEGERGMSGIDTQWLVKAAYFAAAFLFIVGLKRMSSPKTARGGILWAGVGMLVATLATFATPQMENFILMLAAMGLATVLAWWSGKRVAMTDMPQMVALYNGMGGGAAAAIGAVELLGDGEHALAFITLAVAGSIIGAVSFSGSLIAFAKLQGWMRKPLRFGGQQAVNLVVFLATLALGGLLISGEAGGHDLILLFFLAALLFGVLMTLPSGGADMPVVISLYNALTGLAVAFEGFVLDNAAMIIAGTVVGAA